MCTLVFRLCRGFGMGNLYQRREFKCSQAVQVSPKTGQGPKDAHNTTGNPVVSGGKGIFLARCMNVQQEWPVFSIADLTINPLARRDTRQLIAKAIQGLRPWHVTRFWIKGHSKVPLGSSWLLQDALGSSWLRPGPDCAIHTS